MAVTTLGHVHIAGRMPLGTTVNPMIYMAIGTGTPTATALGNEVSRKLFSFDLVANVITYTAQWDADDLVSGTITEAGIFNQNDIMLVSGTFSEVKTIYDNLLITWELTI